MPSSQQVHPKIYIRLRQRVQVPPGHQVVLDDICQLVVYFSEEGYTSQRSGKEEYNSIYSKFENDIRRLPLFALHHNHSRMIAIDIIDVVARIQRIYPDCDIDSLGAAQTIVEIRQKRKSPLVLMVAFVWTILFVGSGLAIMNFHADVSMLDVQRQLYSFITGQENDQPLLLQIPYSIGIGIGMILFFNHVFKKKINDEPSPLELEMFQYQQTVDQYVSTHHQNKELQQKSDTPP